MERVAHRRSKPGGRRGGQSHRSCRPAAAQSVVTSVSHPRGGAKQQYELPWRSRRPIGGPSHRAAAPSCAWRASTCPNRVPRKAAGRTRPLETCVRAYVLTCLRAYVLTCLRAYVLTCVCVCVCACSKCKTYGSKACTWHSSISLTSRPAILTPLEKRRIRNARW